MNTDQFMTDVDTACRSSGGKGLDVALHAAFELEAGQGDLIRKAMQRNLADGVVQFIVLMDRLSERLRDLILFVNRNSKFSIFAVEMDFYRHEGLEIVIPRLHGAEVQKDTRVAVARDEMYNWSEQRFVDTVRRNFARENDTADAVAAMFAFLRGLANDVEFKNMTFEAEDCYAHFSFGQAGGKRAITLATDGTLRLNFRWMERLRTGTELARRLREAITRAAVLDLNKFQVDQGNEYEPYEWTPKKAELEQTLGEVFGPA